MFSRALISCCYGLATFHGHGLSHSHVKIQVDNTFLIA